MKFPSYNSTNKTEVALDAEIFPQFQKLVILEDDVVAGVKPEQQSLQQQKEAFLNNELVCPHLEYEKATAIDYQIREVVLHTLQDDINADTSLHQAVIEAYTWAIEEQIAKLRMLREIHEMQEDGDSVSHMERFTLYSQSIYGAPELEIYKGITDELYLKLERVKESITSKQEVAFNRLHSFATVPTSLHVNPEIVIQESPSEDSAITNTAEIKGYFDEAILEMGLQDAWTVDIDQANTRSDVSVSLENKQVHLPGEEKLKMRPIDRKMTLKMIRGLIVHELGTHALRNYNGLHSKLQLLSTGLDRYIMGEEGLASYREQQETGERNYIGFANYFAASLALGLDGGGKRNFREIYDIFYDFYIVCDEEEPERAKNLAWDRCIRIFRGTTGDVKGAIFTKDIVYRKGHIAVAAFMETQNAKTMNLNAGKFDPTNARHVALLTKLSIL